MKLLLNRNCCKCNKAGQEYFHWNKSWCATCETLRKKLSARKHWGNNRAEKNKEALLRYYKNHARIRAQHKGRWERIKDEAFKKYGGYKCNCCGEMEKLFLTLDHINGGGTKHRKETKGGGQWVYRWILKNDFPPGFQVLCMNCNFGKGQNFRKNGINKCPHENKGN